MFIPSLCIWTDRSASRASAVDPEAAVRCITVAQSVDLSLIMLERSELQEDLLQGALRDLEVLNNPHLHLQSILKEVEGPCEREVLEGNLLDERICVLGLEFLAI